MKMLTQATLTAGDRTLCVHVDSISVFPANNYIRSNAAWVVTDRATLDYCTKNALLRDRITYATKWPAELSALIWGVLTAAAPLQPLMDWVIDNGPANLAAEIEALQKNVLVGSPVARNPEPEEIPF